MSPDAKLQFKAPFIENFLMRKSQCDSDDKAHNESIQEKSKHQSITSSTHKHKRVLSMHADSIRVEENFPKPDNIPIEE